MINWQYQNVSITFYSLLLFLHAIKLFNLFPISSIVCHINFTFYYLSLFIYNLLYYNLIEHLLKLCLLQKKNLLLFSVDFLMIFWVFLTSRILQRFLFKMIFIALLSFAAQIYLIDFKESINKNLVKLKHFRLEWMCNNK